MRASLLFLLTLGSAGVSAAVPETLSLDELLSGGPPRAELLILGTFHFKDAGLDAYKPEVDVDVLSPARQREVEEVVERLLRYKPTRIAIEARGKFLERMQADWVAYRDTDAPLKAHEIQQIGFRLAKRLGQRELFPVDTLGRNYPDLDEDAEVKAAYAACGVDPTVQSEHEQRLFAWYRHNDRVKARQSIRRTLLEANDPRALMASHGHYVLGLGKARCGDQYPGADLITGWWYNRNLRIYSNVAALADGPEQRVLLLIGAGHVPIIRHAAQTAPEIRLREVAEFLGRD
jgi:hypothetical protein